MCSMLLNKFFNILNFAHLSRLPLLRLWAISITYYIYVACIPAARHRRGTSHEYFHRNKKPRKPWKPDEYGTLPRSETARVRFDVDDDDTARASVQRSATTTTTRTGRPAAPTRPRTGRPRGQWWSASDHPRTTISYDTVYVRVLDGFDRRVAITCAVDSRLEWHATHRTVPTTLWSASYHEHVCTSGLCRRVLLNTLGRDLP